ncbi:MAG: ABC transporter ATP-binding protein [Bacteroidota bacterium]
MSVVIENISKSYGSFQALSPVSLEVGKGEIFGLIGPDGAGKTTLFRIVATLLKPDSGRVTVAGKDVVSDLKAVRQILGYMPGRFSLYTDLTVEENLEFYAGVFGTTVRENYDLIKGIYSHIEPFRKRQAGKLSGGMKQKLALSCALIHRPEVLILDEPTTGVDAVSRHEFWEMLDGIRKEGITILVSTPYMDEAALCDRVALIQQGSILLISTPGDIVSSSGLSIYALRNDHGIYRYLSKTRKLPFCRDAWLYGDELHVTLSDEDQEEAMRSVIREWDSGLVFQKVLPSVEDCFINLMQTKRQD